MSEREKTLTINEIYHSIQGESTWAGEPCVFVRLTFCDLRCTYCDTEYAFYEGKKQSLEEIVGGSGEVSMSAGRDHRRRTAAAEKCAAADDDAGDAGQTVLLETSGAHDISAVDPRVHRIMDLKTPGSGECERNLWSNIDHLTKRDEVKFVIGSREDYEWSREKVQRSRSDRTLPRGSFFADLRPDRSARDRRMDPGGQSCTCVSSSRCTSSSGRRRSAECESCSSSS